MVEEILKHYPKIKGIHEACSVVPEMSDEQYDDLVEDVRVNGLLYPIAITGEGLLLDGRNRLSACYDTNTDIRLVTVKSDPWLYVASANIIRRHLSVGQRAFFGIAVRKHFEDLAKGRMSAGGGDKKSGCADLHDPIPDQGRASDQAGQVVGVSARSIDEARKVEEQRPDLAKQVKAGNLSLDAAHKEAKMTEKAKKVNPKPVKVTKDLVFVVTPEGKKKEVSKPKNTKFNQTTDAIDWAHWSWNPVTGCRHDCSFCYAREIAHSDRMESLYPFKFEPTFHEHRLDAPRNTKPPDSDDPRDHRVFVCSMADLFGKWVPSEWIQRVFDVCLESPEWSYLFLTKWPARYAKLPLIDHAWYGASVVRQADVRRVEKGLSSLDIGDGTVRWVSLEPMLERVKFDDLSWCDLMVIGGQTETTQPHGYEEEIAPEFDWIVDVVNQCREAGVPYFLKANVGLDNPGMALPKMSPKE